MIAIPRPQKPDFLCEKGNKWEEETEQAIAFYAKADFQGDFKYKAYSDEKMKEALKAIFVKCAYCESRYDQSSDGDIEHFRPKGKVNEKNPQTPGYYWLANDWDNLLLSCQHCNQRRRHLLYGEQKATSAGKLDQFPLKDNCKHVCSPSGSLEIEEEGRLLLNPCIPKDKPESHFSYDESTGVIISQTDMGKASIKVYALLRPGLVAERNERRLFLFKQMVVVKRLLEDYNVERSVTRKSAFDEELDNLLYYGHPAQPYAGMARFFIKKFLAENGLNA